MASQRNELTRIPAGAAEAFPARHLARVRRRQRLRGRRRWIALAAIVGLLAGSGAAALLVQPIWRSDGTISVEPRDSSDASVGNVAQRLVEVLRRPSVLEAALHSAAAPAAHASATVLLDPQQAGRIDIIVRSPDRATAAAVVGAMIDVGLDRSALRDADRMPARLADAQALVARRRVELAELQQLRRQAEDAFGSASAEDRVAQRRRELDRVNLQLRELRLTLAGLPRADAPTQEPSDDAPPNPRRWARLLGEAIGAVSAATTRHAVVDLDGEPVPPMSLAHLRARAAELESARSDLSTELGDMLAKLATLTALTRRADEARAALATAEAELAALASADAAIAQVHVADRGGTVLLAEPLRVALQLAVPGASGAILLGAAALAAALSDRRLRRADMVQASGDDPPLIGTVPRLADADADATLAQAVHELRAILEVQAENRDARVFAITSPSRGSGKTSLTVGLGTSLALGGTRTLIIDADLAARLTATGSARAPAGQSLDQVMREMGYVEPERAVVHQRSTAAPGRGLAGLLDGATLAASVVPTRVGQLDVLHAHAVEPGHVGRLSSRFMAELLAQARHEYEMVLIDAGPVPGSVEGMLAAAKADGVIVIVRPGETQQRYDRALSHLRMMSAHIVGTVFNGATDRDVVVNRVGTSARRRSGQTAAPVGAGSGILAAAVQAHAGSAFDLARRVGPEEVVPAPDLPPPPIMEDDAAADDSLEASLDDLVGQRRAG